MFARRGALLSTNGTGISLTDLLFNQPPFSAFIHEINILKNFVDLLCRLFVYFLSICWGFHARIALGTRLFPFVCPLFPPLPFLPLALFPTRRIFFFLPNNNNDRFIVIILLFVFIVLSGY
jgi:hypothetical protein